MVKLPTTGTIVSADLARIHARITHILVTAYPGMDTDAPLPDDTIQAWRVGRASMAQTILNMIEEG